LDALAERMTSYVRAGHVQSRGYPVKNRIIEGAVSSPPKYSVTSDKLPARLRAKGLGVVELGVWVGVLSFVDDKTLLAGSMVEAQKMLDVVGEVKDEQLIQYTVSKTVVMQVGRSEDCTLRLTGMVGSRGRIGEIKVDSHVQWIEDGEVRAGVIVKDNGNRTYDISTSTHTVLSVADAVVELVGGQEVTGRDNRDPMMRVGARQAIAVEEKITEVRWWA
jgi:hypothetical protein